MRYSRGEEVGKKAKFIYTPPEQSEKRFREMFTSLPSDYPHIVANV
jgi:hypothetical protein